MGQQLQLWDQRRDPLALCVKCNSVGTTEELGSGTHRKKTISAMPHIINSVPIYKQEYKIAIYN